MVKLSFIKIRNYLLQEAHKLVSHQFLSSKNNPVEHTAFATLLQYFLNSVGKKILVALVLGQDWQSSMSIDGDV